MGIYMTPLTEEADEKIRRIISRSKNQNNQSCVACAFNGSDSVLTYNGRIVNLPKVILIGKFGDQVRYINTADTENPTRTFDFDELCFVADCKRGHTSLFIDGNIIESEFLLFGFRISEDQAESLDEFDHLVYFDGCTNHSIFCDEEAMKAIVHFGMRFIDEVMPPKEENGGDEYEG